MRLGIVSQNVRFLERAGPFLLFGLRDRVKGAGRGKTKPGREGVRGFA
jgi:hypothetical protein